MTTDLKNALKLLGFQTKDENATKERIRLIGSVALEETTFWLQKVTQLLRLAADESWSLDISKYYFLRGDALIFGWRIIVQGNLEKDLPDIIQAVINSRTVQIYDQAEIPVQSNPNWYKNVRTVSAKFDNGPMKT